MEWTVPINDILCDKITKLNYTLTPPSFRGDVRSVRLMQESLSKVIDTLGEQSASAQGLSKVITTAEKLRNTPTHVLYLLKDPASKGGKGEVIGLLKVGRKHLFLFDEKDKVCEVEPLCILDFYVQKDRQRHGYGKILYDYMLQDNDAVAHELAIDGPSPKMEQFLRRSYGIDRLLRQSNNFAVSPQFFDSISTMKSGRSTPVITPAVGRFSAPKPPSAIANVIHGAGADHQYSNTNGLDRNKRAHPSYSTIFMRTSGAATPEPEPKAEIQHEEYEVEPPNTAVNDNEKPEDEPDKKSPERPSTLSVEPISETTASAPSPAGSTMSRRDSQLTDRGYFDVKFYHNKLW